MHAWDPSHDLASVWLPNRSSRREEKGREADPEPPGIDELWQTELEDEPPGPEQPSSDAPHHEEARDEDSLAGALEDEEPWLFPDDEEPTLAGPAPLRQDLPELPMSALEPLH